MPALRSLPHSLYYHISLPVNTLFTTFSPGCSLGSLSLPTPFKYNLVLKAKICIHNQNLPLLNTKLSNPCNRDSLSSWLHSKTAIGKLNSFESRCHINKDECQDTMSKVQSLSYSHTPISLNSTKQDCMLLHQFEYNPRVSEKHAHISYPSQTK